MATASAPPTNFTDTEVKHLLSEDEELNRIDQTLSQDVDGDDGSYSAAAPKKKKKRFYICSVPPLWY